MFCLLTVCSRLQAQEPATNAIQWLEFRQSFIPSPSDLQTIQLKRKQATQIYLAKTANDSPALVAAAADNHFDLGEYQEAAEYYLHTIQLQPNARHPIVRFGLCLYFTGDIKGTRKLLEGLQEHGREYVINHLILAETKHGVGDFGGAREHLERAKSLLDPSMSSSKVVLPFVENNLKALDARAASETGN